MANDIETKRLTDWKVALETYCGCLEKMVEELRGKIEIVPATPALKALAKKSIEIKHASKSFRYAVNRAVDSAPPPPAEYELE